MISRCHRVLRPIALVVLSFFLWTFGGGFEIAHAMKTESQPAAKTSTNQKPDAKFQQTLDDIDRILTDSTTDANTKRNAVKARRADIDALDPGIRKAFADTEKMLRDAGLPAEILNRHNSFVKHYDDNLQELRKNLDALDKAKTKGEIDAAIDKTKKHLDQVNPPKKRSHLDPDKLPHRTAEPVNKEPRTKPDEFLKDDPRSNIARLKSKHVLVASNGPLTTLFDGPKRQQPLSIAQTTSQPTAADLAETVEVRLTPEIRAKAAELGHDPLRIYNWVRNTVEFVPTYGSIQGAAMCLQTKQCNDMDTASLLIALFRASQIPARYVVGTIELPVDKAMNWAGGFTNPYAALEFISSGGTPVKGITSGGKITAIRLEHVWVEAYIDYIPSRGARHKTGQGDTWIRLDASYKQYSYTQPMDIKSAVSFDSQAFIDQIRSTATINETEGYVTNLNSLFIQQTTDDYMTRVDNYLAQNHPNATVGDVLGKKEIVKQEFPYLLGTLPYRDIVAGLKVPEIPDTLRHKITFKVFKDLYDSDFGTPINVTKSLPDIAGKKITLSYAPATAHDEAVINSFLPKPHADGTPIQPSELPSSLPAYLVNVKPELRIDGTVVATGTAVTLGTQESLDLTFITPNKPTDKASHLIIGGEYLALVVNTGMISPDQLQSLKTKLETTKAKLEAQNFQGITKEEIVGDLLYAAALSYYAQLDAMNHAQAKEMGIVSRRLTSEAAFSTNMNVAFIFGVPKGISAGGLAMDVAYNLRSNKALDGNRNKDIQFTLAAGTISSALEHSVPEQLFSTPGAPTQAISAVKAMKMANDQGIPLYTVSTSNIEAILPQLQVDPDVKENIRNAVNAGKIVTVSKTNITVNSWTGCGYIVIDPSTGAGAYMISGGLNGGFLDLVLDQGHSYFVMLAFIVSLYSFIAMAVALAAGVGGLALFSGVVAGFLLGVGVSQIWNPTYQARKAINDIVQVIIGGILMGQLAVAGFFGFWGLVILWILLMISNELKFSPSSYRQEMLLTS